MMKKILPITAIISVNILLLLFYKYIIFNTYVSYEIKSDSNESLQLFWVTEKSKEYDEAKSRQFHLNTNSLSEARFTIPYKTDIAKLRLDFGKKPANFYITNFYIRTGLFTKVVINNDSLLNIFTNLNQIESISKSDGFIYIKTSADDGFIASDSEKFYSNVEIQKSVKFLFEDRFMKFYVVFFIISSIFLFLTVIFKIDLATSTNKIIKKYNFDNYLFLIICALLIVVPLFFANFNTGDYENIRDKALNLGIIGFYKKVITGWSSRYIIDFIVILMCSLPIFIWGVLNTLFVLLATFSIRRVISPINKDNRIVSFFVLTLVLCYPFIQMRGAGWVVTTATYLWPAASLAYSLIIIKKILTGEKIRVYEYPLSILAYIYGVDSELAVAVMVPAIFAIIVFWFVKNRNIQKYLSLVFIISLISLVLDITSKGNKSRFVSETINWFPNYPNLTFFEKFHLGIDSTFAVIMSTNASIITAFLFILIFINVYERYDKNWHIIFPSIPLLFLIWNEIILKKPDLFYSPLSLYYTLEITSNAYIIFSIIVACCTIYSIYLIYKENLNKFLILTLILLSGFASRMVMIFSPTLFASGHRTYNILYLAMMIISTQLFYDTIQNITGRYRKLIYLLLCIVAYLGYVSNIL